MTNKIDSRTVHTDALETLGTIIDEHQKRDAIHLAVEPMIAGQTLYPGYNVFIVNGKAFDLPAVDLDLRAEEIKYVGIVDPFLKDPVKKGERFWLVLYPRMITSLRHVWTHPDFDDVEDLPTENNISEKEKSEQWLRDFFDDAPLGAEEDIINNIIEGEGYTYHDFSKYIPPELYHHLKVARGIIVDDDNKIERIYCSC